MSNGIIGIFGVFAFTLLLFMFRSFYLSPRRPAKERSIAPVKLRGLYDTNKRADADDNWLLWSEDLHGEAGSSDRVDDRLTNLANR
jgi:hypothetical protein